MRLCGGRSGFASACLFVMMEEIEFGGALEEAAGVGSIACCVVVVIVVVNPCMWEEESWLASRYPLCLLAQEEGSVP